MNNMIEKVIDFLKKCIKNTFSCNNFMYPTGTIPVRN